MTQKPTAKSFGNTYLSGNTRTNCPEKSVTEDASKRDPVFQSQPHCPLNNVTEQASLKSLESQGGDLVEGPSKWDYVRVMSERYQNGCRKEKRLILDELEKNLKVHRKSAVRAFYKAQYRRHWNSGTRAGKYIKTMIPLKALDYNVTSIGHVEADTVHHCGGSLSGAYALTLTVTDILTSWTECRAMWGKSMFGVTECMKDIEKHLPFKIVEICTDNGNEFLNHQFVRYLQDREEKVPLKRGRPYRKNDQCYVEQKNFTHVRELFGWDRMDKKELIEVMNDIYRNEWSLLQNLFYPSMKLQHKLRVGAKYKKKYSEPQTPLERVLASPSVAAEVKEKLRQLEQTIDPFELKKSIETKLKIINKLLQKTEEDPEGIPA